ncbi:MAG: glycosyl hydrolase family 8, partial [Patescibacteria group bacterium]|nr:glycosyl hydrolase family 8 [Patescibacteria group bacterium]
MKKKLRALRAKVTGNSQVRKLSTWVKEHKLETFVLLSVVVISVVFHAWNMFHFPYFENDEATYSSRAWSFITTGNLDVYTYRYDHAPFGWIIMGLWFFITGGTYFFDSLLSSGRVLMLVVHVISTLLVYIIAKRFSRGSVAAGFFAAAIFSVAPIGIYFQRRILLDNLMVAAFLLSVYFLTKNKMRLKDYISSAMIFGIAVLIKLNAIFLAPVMVFLVWKRARKHHRVHAVMYWMAFCGLVIALFFMFALLKDELLSAPIGSNGLPMRVSVVDTFQLQLGRGDFAWPWNPKSSFRLAFESWMLKDNITIVAGLISTIFVTIIGFFRRKRDPYYLSAALFVWCYMLFLARGKLVLDLYVAPMTPLFTINIGLLVAWVASKVRKRWQALFLVIVFVAFGAAYAYKAPTRHLWVDETTNQTRAIEWVKENVPKNAKIVTDNYVYPQLAQQYDYQTVLYFFNAEYDPEVKAKYQDDWRNFDYIIVTHEIVRQIKSGEVPRMREVFDHAELVADFSTNSSSYIDLNNYISTNGDWVKIYKVKSRNDIVLQDSWKHFYGEYIDGYGQIVNRDNEPISTSTDQALAMQRALEVSDRNAFQGIWQWSKDHLRYREKDKLLSWLWTINKDGEFALADSNNVCVADQKIAQQLYLAADKWDDATLLTEAEEITRDWWRQCVFERNGRLYLDSSADGANDDRLLNPGYFDPDAYRYLATKDLGLPFDKLVTDGYWLMESLEQVRGSIPNWIILQTDGLRSSAQATIGATADEFGVDSLQLIQNLAKDSAKSGDPRAMELLKKIYPDVVRFRETSPTSSQGNISLLITYQMIPSTGDAQSLYESY